MEDQTFQLKIGWIVFVDSRTDHSKFSKNSFFSCSAIGNNNKKSVVKKQSTVKYVTFEEKEKSCDVEIDDK
jgi:hypothetical protein